MNLIELFEGEHTYYIITEYLRGKTLAEELENLKVGYLVIIIGQERKAQYRIGSSDYVHPV